MPCTHTGQRNAKQFEDGMSEQKQNHEENSTHAPQQEIDILNQNQTPKKNRIKSNDKH